MHVVSKIEAGNIEDNAKRSSRCRQEVEKGRMTGRWRRKEWRDEGRVEGRKKPSENGPIVRVEYAMEEQ